MEIGERISPLENFLYITFVSFILNEKDNFKILLKG